MKCLNCQKEFIPERSSKVFCSASCRTKHHIKGGGKSQTPARVNTPQISFMGLSGNPSFDYIFQKTERENEQLKSENVTLRDKLDTEREKFRDLKLNVDTQTKLSEADKALESSKGLGGFVDKVTSNDKLMGVIEKIALAKLGVSDKSDNEDLLDGIEENKMLLQTIVSLISEKDQEFLAHFVKITQWFSSNPELLISASNNINKAKKLKSKTAI